MNKLQGITPEQLNELTGGLTDTEGISKLFSAGIREELTPEELKEVIELNNRYQGEFCATHEYCDSNIIMSKAWGKWFEGERFFDAFKSVDVEIWNEAWRLSMKADFKN
jgi:hypothetical protein